MKQPLRKLADKLDYRFNDDALFEQALTHRSVGTPNNERLEFLGDAVLNHLIATELYHCFPALNEGDLSRLRANLVKGDTLASIAVELRIGDYLLLGPGEAKTGGAQRRSILAGTLEAIIGAVYLDGGFDPCRAMVERIFRERLAAVTPEAAQKDPKTRLQEYLQSRALALPEYQVRCVEGPAHEQVFIVECHIAGGTEPITGTGGSRRKAEQDAASRALTRLQEGSD